MQATRRGFLGWLGRTAALVVAAPTLLTKSAKALVPGPDSPLNPFYWTNYDGMRWYSGYEAIPELRLLDISGGPPAPSICKTRLMTDTERKAIEDAHNPALDRALEDALAGVHRASLSLRQAFDRCVLREMRAAGFRPADDLGSGHIYARRFKKLQPDYAMFGKRWHLAKLEVQVTASDLELLQYNDAVRMPLLARARAQVAIKTYDNQLCGA